MEGAWGQPRVRVPSRRRRGRPRRAGVRFLCFQPRGRRPGETQEGQLSSSSEFSANFIHYFIQSSPQMKGRGKEKQEPLMIFFETLLLTPISLTTHITHHTSKQSARVVRSRGTPGGSSPGGATRRAVHNALRVRCECAARPKQQPLATPPHPLFSSIRPPQGYA